MARSEKLDRICHKMYIPSDSLDVKERLRVILLFSTRRGAIVPTLGEETATSAMEERETKE